MMCDEENGVDLSPDDVTCPACGNSHENAVLGRLGARLHFRCRSCGMTFSTRYPDPDSEEE